MTTKKESLLATLVDATSELSSVEELIRSKFESESKLLRDIPEYLLSVGGKRIRPLLCLLCAKAFGAKSIEKEIISIAAGIELIHMATLLHDDIIDKSDLRRHKESAFQKYGLESTLLSGDFLLVRAFSLCATLPSEIIDQTEKACVALTEGEILETALFLEEHSIESSLNISKKKTAALFSLAGFSAAFLMKSSDKCCQHLYNFGENIGIAFQILDDILDVTSTKEKLGKPPGIDIRERKPSALNMIWLSTNTDLSNRLKTKPTQDEDTYVANSISEILASDVVEKTKDLAKSYAVKAREEFRAALKEANDVSEKHAKMIESLIEYTLVRLV